MLTERMGIPAWTEPEWSAETKRLVSRCCEVLDRHVAGSSDPKWMRMKLNAVGFMTSLLELEQSRACSEAFATELDAAYEEDLTKEEHERYHLHLYFYKNALIRIFSTLDKLGYFMNDAWDLKTERIKPRFSYYTVLRQLHNIHRLQGFERELQDIKIGAKHEMRRMREKRNMEIHYINVEFLDDLARSRRGPNGKLTVENLQSNLRDLASGHEMLSRSLSAVMAFALNDWD